MSQQISTVAAILFLLSAWAGQVQAGYLQAFSGNTRSATGVGGGDVTGEFAVLDRLSGNSVPGDVFGTGFANFDSAMSLASGSTAFDTTARYLYLYEHVVSPSSADDFIGDGYGDQSPRFSGVTSYGEWNLMFSDNAGPLSSSNSFGTDGIAFSGPSPANLGVISPSIVSPGATLLHSVSLTLSPTSFQSTFFVSPGQITELYGFTSNVPPTMLTQSEGPNFAGGTLPVPTPEPASWILAVLGLLGLLCVTMRRRNANWTTAGPL
jgi:hypothetical protein